MRTTMGETVLIRRGYALESNQYLFDGIVDYRVLLCFESDFYTSQAIQVNDNDGHDGDPIRLVSTEFRET